MRYGVVRIIAEELKWLNRAGRYGDLSAITWSTADKTAGYAHARAHSGLLLKIDETQLPLEKNALGSPRNRFDSRSATLTLPESAVLTEAQAREISERLRNWRKRGLIGEP